MSLKTGYKYVFFSSKSPFYMDVDITPFSEAPTLFQRPLPNMVSFLDFFKRKKPNKCNGQPDNKISDSKPDNHINVG